MTKDPPAAAPALKEIFDRERMRHIAAETKAVWPGFDARRFMALATKKLDELGIMERMRLVASSLHETLPGGFQRNIEILKDLAPRIGHSFVAISLSEYVALNGRHDFAASMDALRYFTRFGSAEYAIRPFLLHDLHATLDVMRGWTADDDEHVRRLASEGCRPRLPWSFQIKALIADPSPVAPILDALRADPAIYVRKSVANHLNHITKDHPDWVLARVGTWSTADARTEWIVRHALRTLIKKGDARALSRVGASGKADVGIDSFAVEPADVRLGERIRIAARLSSTAQDEQRLVIDYAIHYVRQRGTASRKVFKLKEVTLAAGASVDLSISQVVRDFTTRKHHPGHHRIELLVNGAAIAETGFDLSE